LVAVLGGTGQQGRGLVMRLAAAGVPVIVGSRDPNRAEAAIQTWPRALTEGGASGARVRPVDYGTAIAEAEIVVLAVPFESVDALLEEHQPRFREQALVIDITVPITVVSGALTLLRLQDGSAAEHVRARLPAHVRVAATFKTVPAALLNDLDRSLDCDEFVCGDSQEARTRAMDVVKTIGGLRAVDVGPLTRARSLEHLTLLAIAINRRNKIHEARFRVVGLEKTRPA
jgi:hypothetical protein